MRSPSRRPRGKHIAVKEAVFPFARFPGVDIILGPEMRSTGEVMGLDQDFGRAFAKSQLGAGIKLPVDGASSSRSRTTTRRRMVEPVERLVELGFKVVATGGTADFLRQARHRRAAGQQGAGGPAAHRRRDEGRQGPAGLQHHRRRSALADSFTLRRTALMHKIPYYTTVAGARPRSRRSPPAAPGP